MPSGGGSPSLSRVKKTRKASGNRTSPWEGTKYLVECNGQENSLWAQIQARQDVRTNLYRLVFNFLILPSSSPIIHPLVDPRTTPICLITKDPQRQYKDLLESNEIKFISRVVGVEKLKGKFKPFEARRALLKENGLFLADERVIPLLPKLLGTKWFEAKK